MTTPRVGVNMRVEIQKTLASTKTITNITKANPGVVSSTAHGYSNGDVIVLNVPQGMVELDAQSARVANKTNDDYELEGIDTSDYSDFDPDDGDSPPAAASLVTSKKITAFETWSNATSISNPNVTPQKLDSTVLLNKRKKYVFAMPDSAEGSVNTIFEPNNAAEQIIKAASKSNTPLVFRCTWNSGQVRIFNANVAGGVGFDQQGNAIATGSCAFTVLDEPNDFDE